MCMRLRKLVRQRRHLASKQAGWPPITCACGRCRRPSQRRSTLDPNTCPPPSSDCLITSPAHDPAQLVQNAHSQLTGAARALHTPPGPAPGSNGVGAEQYATACAPSRRPLHPSATRRRSESAGPPRAWDRRVFDRQRGEQRVASGIRATRDSGGWRRCRRRRQDRRG